MRRLNIGSGYVMPADWTNVDMLDYGGNQVADLLTGLPFPDAHFDYIVSQHQIQMIRFDDLQRGLGELRRVLKVAGVLRISVPDAELAVHRFLADWDQFPISHEVERTKPGRFLRYLMWHGDARSAFTFESLTDTLNRNGFQNVRRCEFKQTHSSYPEIVDLDGRKSESLIIECTR